MGIHVGQNSWPHEVTFSEVRARLFLAAAEDLRAVFFRRFDLGKNIAQTLSRHEWAKLCLNVERISQRNSPSLFGQDGYELVVQFGRDEQSGTGKAHLGLSSESLGKHAIDRLIPIDVVANDYRSFSAKFEDRWRNGMGRLMQNLSSTLRSACEDDFADFRMFHYKLAD